MRLRAVLTAGALTASLLATGLPVHAATSDPAQVSVTKAKAQKLAKAAVLTKSDLAAFRSSPSEPNTPEYETELAECLGVKIPTPVAENPGLSFEKGAQTIDSTAYVLSTGKAAKADFNAFMTKKADNCVAKSFRAGFEAEGATVDSVRVRRFALSVPGADAAFGQRYTISGSFDGFAFQVVGLSLNIRIGPTQFSVGPTRYDGKDPNLTQAQGLVAKLVKRVRAV